MGKMKKGRGALKNVYLACMAVGTFIPVFLATPHLDTYGFSPIVFIQHANSTSAAAAVFADLCLAGLVFLVFCAVDIRQRRAPSWELLATAVLMIIGLVTAICFYLYRRECTNLSPGADSGPSSR